MNVVLLGAERDKYSLHKSDMSERGLEDEFGQSPLKMKARERASESETVAKLKIEFDATIDEGSRPEMDGDGDDVQGDDDEGDDIYGDLFIGGGEKGTRDAGCLHREGPALLNLQVSRVGVLH